MISYVKLEKIFQTLNSGEASEHDLDWLVLAIMAMRDNFAMLEARVQNMEIAMVNIQDPVRGKSLPERIYDLENVVYGISDN